jgi:hypothetical protein
MIEPLLLRKVEDLRMPSMENQTVTVLVSSLGIGNGMDIGYKS